MVPAHPPLPTARSLPFHPVVGSQTSILIFESVDGVNVAATLQNAGKSVKALAGGAGCPAMVGMVKVPGATVSASVTLVAESTVEVSRSQVCVVCSPGGVGTMGVTIAIVIRDVTKVFFIYDLGALAPP